MIFFLLMASVSTLFFLRSGLSVLRSRFLPTVDLAVIVTWYYTVPLAIFGYFRYNPDGRVFLHAAAMDPAIATQSMEYCVIAILALVGGQAIGRSMGAARIETFFRVDPAGEMRARLAFLGLIGLIGVGIIQFGIAQFLQGYATESDLQGATLGIALVYFAVGSLGLVIAYALLLHRVTGRRSLLFLMLLAVLCALAVLLIRAKRLEIVTMLLPAIILLLAGRSTLKVTASRLALGAVVILGLIAVSVIRVGDKFDLSTLSFYFLSEGLYAGHSLPGIIAWLNANMIDYENGFRFVSSLLAFVPRFLWPEKDEIVYAGNAALQDISPLGATSILTEIVLQGGAVAVLLCYGLMGLVFQRTAQFETVWDEAMAAGYIPRRFIAYLVLTAIFVPHFRDGIIPAIKLTLQAGVFMILLVGLQSLRAPRGSQPAHTVHGEVA